MPAKHPVIHFEMPYEDAARVRRFYEDAFGWPTQLFGPEMGDYVLAETTESDRGRPTAPGAINGGFFPRDAARPDEHPSVVIHVGDIAAAMKAVTAAKGEVLGEPMDIPGIGRYVAFRDTEGNRVSMLQPSDPENENGPA